MCVQIQFIIYLFLLYQASIQISQKILINRTYMHKYTENVIDFLEDRYPTLLISEPLPQYFRVTLPKQISAEDIIKLTSIHHLNIVNIKKILKIKKDNNSQQQNLNNSDYAIYYEAVRIGKPKGKIVSQSLNRAVQFLICQGIFFKVTAQNVGYDSQGNIKIFVPPSVVLGYKQKAHIKQVFEALNALIEDFESIPKQKLDKVKLIDDQLKNLKNKLNEANFKKEQLPIKKNAPLRLNSEQNELDYKYQMKFFPQTPITKPVFRDASVDKLHQNFHRIYPNRNNQLGKKLSQPKLKYFNKLRQYQTSDSQDTYQKQMGQQPQMPNLAKKKFRETVQVNQINNEQITNPKPKKKKTVKKLNTLNIDPSANSLFSIDTKQTLLDNDQSQTISIQYQEPNKFCRNTFDVGFTITRAKSQKNCVNNQYTKKQQFEENRQIKRATEQSQKIETRVQQVLKKTKTTLQLLKQNKFRKSYQKN